jgi:hypothetical protein
MLAVKVRVIGVRYWPVEFKEDSNWETLQYVAFLSNICLYTLTAFFLNNG